MKYAKSKDWTSFKNSLSSFSDSVEYVSEQSSISSLSLLYSSLCALWDGKLAGNAGKTVLTGQRFPSMIPQPFPIVERWRLSWKFFSQYARWFAHKQISWSENTICMLFFFIFPIVFHVSLHSPTSWSHKDIWFVLRLFNAWAEIGRASPH